MFNTGLVAWLRARLGGRPTMPAVAATPREYWSGYNVTGHKRFATAAQSLAELAWRNAQYFGYMKLMPVAGHDGEVILDFGCGPGHDLVGFAAESRPALPIGADVSRPSLDEAAHRLALHGIPPQLLALDADSAPLPLDDG